MRKIGLRGSHILQCLREELWQSSGSTTSFPAPDTMSQTLYSRNFYYNFHGIVLPFVLSSWVFSKVILMSGTGQFCGFLTFLPWAILLGLATLAPMPVALAQWIMVPEKVEMMAVLYQGGFGSGWGCGSYWRLKIQLNLSQQHLQSPALGIPVTTDTYRFVPLFYVFRASITIS